MSYTPKQDSDVDCLHWHALNYRTAGLDAQSAWVELEAFFDKQIKEAYQAGRASRDAEVAALKAKVDKLDLELRVAERARDRRDESIEILTQTVDQLRLEAEGLERFRADAERYRWLMRNQLEKDSNFGKPFLVLQFEADGHDLDQAIDAAMISKESL